MPELKARPEWMWWRAWDPGPRWGSGEAQALLYLWARSGEPGEPLWLGSR